MIEPADARAAPTRSPIIATGRRISITIVLSLISAPAGLKIVLKISPTVAPDDPVTRLKKTAPTMIHADTIRTIALFFVYEI